MSDATDQKIDAPQPEAATEESQAVEASIPAEAATESAVAPAPEAEPSAEPVAEAPTPEAIPAAEAPAPAAPSMEEELDESAITPLDLENMEIGDDFYDGTDEMRAGFMPGEKVEATIVNITRETVFIDIHSKSEGMIDRLEFEKDGELKVAIGDTITAYFADYDSGSFNFTVRMQGHDVVDDDLVNAAQNQIPIEGKIEAERKGGFAVKVGRHNAFCPYSQIDLYGTQPADAYIGQTFTFQILEYSSDNFVVSRRKLLEAKREEMRAETRGKLEEGSVVEGTVRKVLDFGAFVDLGGLDGLIPANELSWDRSQSPDEVVSVGDRLKVKIERIDRAKDRISLSLKKVGGDPWETVTDRYHPTQLVHGKVSRLLDFGAFVALEPGIDGLVHISKLGAGKRLRHADEVLEEGQALDVYIESIDTERRRISLALENVQIGREMEVDEGETLTVGEEITGVVDSIKQFGIFIKVTPKQTGLLHVSELSFDGMVNKGRDMYKRFPPGSEIKVIVQNIQGNRISLSLPSKADEESQEFRQHLTKESGSAGLGSLDDLFSGLNL